MTSTAALEGLLVVDLAWVVAAPQYQALAGHEGELPIGPFGPYTDYVGPRFGLVALLAALEQRRSTGLGCWLDVSQA